MQRTVQNTWSILKVVEYLLGNILNNFYGLGRWLSGCGDLKVNSQSGAIRRCGLVGVVLMLEEVRHCGGGI